MKKLSLFIVLAILSLAIGCSTFLRKPTAADIGRAKAAVFQIDDDKSMVVIGMDQKGLVENQGVDFNEMTDHRGNAFRGYDIDQLQPKYVILKNSKGIQKVHSFGLNFFFPRSPSGKGLPPELLDVPKARRSLGLKSVADFLVRMGKSIPLAGSLVVLADQGRNERENSKLYQSEYLREILDRMIDSGESEFFGGALNRDEALMLASSLKLRYTDDLQLSGILTAPEKRVEFYQIWRDSQKGTASKNLGMLVKIANQEGLVAVPITDEFVLLFADKDSVNPKEHWRSFMVDVNRDEIQKALDERNANFKMGSLIPLGVYSVHKDVGPQQLSNYLDAYEAGTQQKLINAVNLGMDLGYTFIPGFELSFAIRATDSVARFVAHKKGVTVFEKVVGSYAELAAISEMGLADVDVQDIYAESYLQALREMNVEENKINQFSVRLKSKSKSDVSDAVSEINAILAEREHNKSLLYSGRDREKAIERQKLYVERLKNFVSDKDKMQSLKNSLDPNYKPPVHANPKFGPRAGLTKNNRDLASVNDPKPVIVFMVDGLRPDRFKEAAEKGWVPNLKKLFLDSGAELESYTPRSLTLPSWSTILTGYSPDETGVRGNSTASRLSDGEIASYLDVRKDILLPKYIKKGHSYRRIEQSKLQWLPRYFNRDQVAMNFSPINDRLYPPVINLIKNQLVNLPAVLRGAYPGVTNWDEASSSNVVWKIKDEPGQTRLAMVWLASIDEHSHYMNANMNSGYAYKVIDETVGKVLAAAENDPVLKDATVFLVSDHGHLGGRENADPKRTFAPHAHELHNTGFNLVQYFAGDYAGAKKYRFRVGSEGSPEPDFDLKYLHEFFIHPFSFTYAGHRGSPSKGRSLMVDFSGDNMAQVYVRGKSGRWTNRPYLSFHDLTNFESEAVEGVADIPNDLLQFTLRNSVTTDAKVRQSLAETAGNRPVKFFAMALQGEKALISSEHLTGGTKAGLSTRPPVIVRDRDGKTGMIMVRRNAYGVDQFRYSIIKNFSQDSNGVVTGTLSLDPKDDPLKYLGLNSEFENNLKWRTDREWLQLTKNSSWPTAIFSIPQTVTLAPNLNAEQEAVSQLPDFVLYPHRGYAFQSGKQHESDHGGLYPEEVKHSFFISGIGERKMNKRVVVPKAVLSRDFTPTVLDFAGFGVSEVKTQGESLKPHVEVLQDSGQ